MLTWTHAELIHSEENTYTFAEAVDIDPAAFKGSSLVNSVENVMVDGNAYLDEESEIFYVHLHIEGTMLVPDAVTGEEIEYPFETESDEAYSFAESEDDSVRVVTDDVIELMPAIIDDILLEAPLQVTIASEEDYPKGDGWRVISEEEYQKSQEQRLDPRLAKLKDFKADE